MHYNEQDNCTDGKPLDAGRDRAGAKQRGQPALAWILLNGLKHHLLAARVQFSPRLARKPRIFLGNGKYEDPSDQEDRFRLQLHIASILQVPSGDVGNL